MEVRAVGLAADERPDAASSGSVTTGVPELRRVLANMVALTGAYVVPRLCTFAAAVVAARALGVTAFGAWGSAAALAVILSVTATLGMMPMLVREIARSPERAPALLGAANVAKLVTVLLMLVATVLVASGPLAYDRDVVLATLLLALAYGAGAFAENLGAWFQGVERMEVWMQAQAVYGVVTGVLGIVLAVVTRDLVAFCAAPLVGQIAALLWLRRSAPPEIRRAWIASSSEVARLVSGLVPFAVAFLLLSAYYKVDIILLERWRGSGEAGVYAAAYRFVDVAQALSVVIASALYPRLSRMGETPGNAAARSVELVFLAAAPAAALLWMVRDPLINTLFGEGYAAATAALALLAPALPFLAVNALGTFVLAAAGRIGRVGGAYAAALVANVILNRLWIPGAGANGAARAMLVAETTLAIALVVAVGLAAGRFPRLRAIVPALAALGLPFAIEAVGLPPAAAVAVYAVAVALLYAAFRVITTEERALLARAVRP